MQQICKNCEHILRNDDDVKAVVRARFRELASTVTYAITKPTECLDIFHYNCQFPQGAPEGD